MKTLVAEDDPIFRRILQSSLAKWGYEAVTACDGEQAWRILQNSGAPQLAILDWMMPRMDGVDICRQIRRLGREPYVYIVLLTSRDHLGDLIEGMDAGADDYLSKPFDPEELKARLRAGRRILDLQQQLLAAREELRQQATHDALTGLWNRPAIREALHIELERMKREHNPVSIALADIDRFKQVNDRLGHSCGDTVLREIASRLQSSLRPYDKVGRYGGEEFLIVFPGCDLPRAIQLAERLRDRVAGESVYTSEAGLIGVTISMGVAAASEDEPCDPDGLIDRADAGLYGAKNHGRNRVCVAGDVCAFTDRIM